MVAAVSLSAWEKLHLMLIGDNNSLTHFCKAKPEQKVYLLYRVRNYLFISESLSLKKAKGQDNKGLGSWLTLLLFFYLFTPLKAY